MYKCRINKLDPLGAGLVDLLLKQANRPFSYPFENPDMLHTCRSLRKLDLFLTWQEVTEASDFEECNCNSSLNGGMSEWELLEHSRHAIPGYLWVFFSGSPTPGNRDLGNSNTGSVVLMLHRSAAYFVNPTNTITGQCISTICQIVLSDLIWVRADHSIISLLWKSF